MVINISRIVRFGFLSLKNDLSFFQGCFTKPRSSVPVTVAGVRPGKPCLIWASLTTATRESSGKYFPIGFVRLGFFARVILPHNSCYILCWLPCLSSGFFRPSSLPPGSLWDLSPPWLVSPQSLNHFQALATQGNLVLRQIFWLSSYLLALSSQIHLINLMGSHKMKLLGLSPKR